jgi:Ca-activated chloride channel family protein
MLFWPSGGGELGPSDSFTRHLQGSDTTDQAPGQTRRMKLYSRWCGMALAFGLSSAGAATLNLQLDPDRRLVPAGKEQEVVVKIDVDSDTCRRPNRLPLNIAVVIDHSGSMAGAKIEKTKQAAMQLIDQLTPEDNLALIEFDDTVEVLFPSQHVVDREALKAEVQRIEPGGSTALYGGVESGGKQLLKIDSRTERINRVILLSDGLANVGPSSTSALKGLGRSLSRQSVSVTTIGVGDDYNEDLMAGLAEASDANYYYVQDAEKLPEIFAKELGGLQTVTARDVQVIITCADGVQPVDLIGRPEKFVDRKTMVEFSPFASGQKRYLFLRCRVKASDSARQMGLASVKVTYRDEINGSQEASTEQNVQIGVTTNEQEVADAVNQTVAAERELQLNALAKDQAMSDADAGKYRNAAESLRANAQKLEAVAANAPMLVKRNLESQAQEQRARAQEIDANGMSKSMRKMIQSESYNTRNGKE